MGGQACVLYGAAEFSRDTDLAILGDKSNLTRLKLALDHLNAEVIAVPPFDLKYLRRGHAIHFRCHHPDAEGLRVDIMSKMRGVVPFARLWARRTTVHLSAAISYDLLSLPDLVQAKKTQRDKDWPMIRRLVEAHYFEHRDTSEKDHVQFWFMELRTPELLMELAERQPKICRSLSRRRELLMCAARRDLSGIELGLATEEAAVRAEDRLYWEPLRRELEQLRHQKSREAIRKNPDE